MKLKRYLFATLLPLAVFVAAMMPSTAFALTGTYVFDERGMFDHDQFTELETQGARYADTYGVGVYLLVTDSMGANEDSGSGRNYFARDYMENNRLGVGPNRDGIIFVIAVDSRKYVTVKHFVDESTDPFSDDSVDYLEDEVVEQLKDDHWYAASAKYYEIIGDHLEYFATNGTQWTEPHVMALLVKVAITLFFPLLVAIGVVNNEKEAMLTAKTKTEASDYLKPNSLELHVQTDTFVRKTMSVTPRPTDDDRHSGGGWSDMGGGYSGSGGGSF